MAPSYVYLDYIRGAAAVGDLRSGLMGCGYAGTVSMSRFLRGMFCVADVNSKNGLATACSVKGGCAVENDWAFSETMEHHVTKEMVRAYAERWAKLACEILDAYSDRAILYAQLRSTLIPGQKLTKVEIVFQIDEPE